jgi:hypothetical protein
MAAVALNTFKTIRKKVTTSEEIVYTCPIGVATIILLAQVTNVDPADSTPAITAIHSRASEDIPDYKFANEIPIPPNDGASLVPDGRLVLETGDSIKISGSSNNTMHLILSILETAKQ